MDFCIQLENLKKIARMVGRQVCCLLVFFVFECCLQGKCQHCSGERVPESELEVS